MPSNRTRRLLFVLALLLVLTGVGPASAQDPVDDDDDVVVDDGLVDRSGSEREDDGDADDELADDEDAGTEILQGQLRFRSDDGLQVIPQAEIEVATADGEPIGTAFSDEEGRFRFALPGPGRYTATLDIDTLPEGISLRNPDRQTLDLSVAPNQSVTLLFVLQEGDGPGRRGASTADRAARLFASGVIFGLIIAISAVGLSLIFGTTGLVNFAHGELVAFGGIMTYLFNVTIGLPLPLAALAAITAATLAGAASDKVFWGPLRRRGTGLIALLVISIGLGVLLRYIFVFQFGDRLRSLRYTVPGSPVTIGPVTLVPREILTIVVSVAVLMGVAYVLQRTRIGKAMRAVSDNRDLAESSGIDVQRVITFVWASGAGLAALGGVLLGMAEQVGWLMGFQLLLRLFAGVILGGLGTAYGALVGSLVVGIFIQMSTLVIPTDLKNVGALLMLAIILVIRPQGILGQPERIG